jgi:replication-associated recombination protein RarA
MSWIEKYRPKSLENIIGQKNVIDQIQNFVKDGNIPNLLVYGPPGT